MTVGFRNDPSLKFFLWSASLSLTTILVGSKLVALIPRLGIRGGRVFRLNRWYIRRRIRRCRRGCIPSSPWWRRVIDLFLNYPQ